jgi:hypothetical protein
MESYSDIMALKNIIQFDLTINSLQDKSLLEFTTKLIDWTSQGIKIFLNFSNPTLVSTGSIFDTVNIMVLNGSNFTSENENISMIVYLGGDN